MCISVKFKNPTCVIRFENSEKNLKNWRLSKNLGNFHIDWSVTGMAKLNGQTDHVLYGQWPNSYVDGLNNCNIFQKYIHIFTS